MIQKQEFLALVQEKANMGRKGKKIPLRTIRTVCNAIEDVIYDTVTKGQDGEYGIHYPKLGKLQTIYCPEKEYYDLNMRKNTIKEAHYKVQILLSNSLMQAPDLYRKNHKIW